MNDKIPTSEEILKQLTGGKSYDPSTVLSRFLGWLIETIRTLQNIWAFLTVVAVFVGLGIIVAGAIFKNPRWKISGVYTIVTAVIVLILVRIAPVVILALERAIK